MKTRMLLQLLLFPFVVFARDNKDAFPLPARPTQALISMEDFSSTYSTCSGDLVTVEGTYMLEYHIPEHGKQVVLHGHYINVKGTSLSTGENYRVILFEDLVLRTVQTGETFVITGKTILHIISESSSDNLWIQEFHHLVLKPDGTIRKIIDHEEVECR